MKVFEKQGYHLLALTLLAPVALAAGELLLVYEGQLFGFGTPTWFVASLAVAVAHQLVVLLSWRSELHYGFLSGRLGLRAFPIFQAVFMALLTSRLILLLGLAIANRGSLGVDVGIRLLLASLLAIPAGYVVYSVIRYFGIKRAAGVDHFDPDYRAGGLETRGSFGLMRNSIYVLGFLIFWIPGIAFGSKAALLAALFQHVYIWVHYHTVERPDMRHIYGEETIT